LAGRPGAGVPSGIRIQDTQASSDQSVATLGPCWPTYPRNPPMSVLPQMLQRSRRRRTFQWKCLFQPAETIHHHKEIFSHAFS